MSLDIAWQSVKDFHIAFKHPVANSPERLDADRVKTRLLWLREELDEFEDASNLVDQADAMIDLIYFALGTLVEMGVSPESLFRIVHDANMAKLGPDGAPIYNSEGKVVKPIGWKDPMEELEQALQRQLIGSCEKVD